MPQGGSLTLILSATDANAADPILFTAVSDRTQVATSVVGNRVTLTPAANFSGTARITLAAHDGPSGPGDSRGRRAEQTFLLSVGLGTVTGTVWQDLDGDGTRDPGDAGREAWRCSSTSTATASSTGRRRPTATTPWFAVDQLAGGSHVGDAGLGPDRLRRLRDGSMSATARPTTSTAGIAALGQFVQFTVDVGFEDARGPRAIAFGIDGDLYVASNFDRNVRRYNGTTGAFVEELWPSNSGVLVSDRGIMAASPDRRILYIADFNPAAGVPVQIVRYDTQTHALLTSFSVTRVAGVFDEPSDIAIGPDGHIYRGRPDARQRHAHQRRSTGRPLPAPGPDRRVFIAPGPARSGRIRGSPSIPRATCTSPAISAAWRASAGSPGSRWARRRPVSRTSPRPTSPSTRTGGCTAASAARASPCLGAG